MTNNCPRLDLFATIGEQLEITISLPTANNGWRELVDASGLAQVRVNASDVAAVANFSVEIDDAEQKVILTLPPEESQSLTVGADYEWDLRLSWLDGDVVYPVAGVFKVRAAVSRP